jgi:amino acid adenylation domain-containing protein
MKDTLQKGLELSAADKRVLLENLLRQQAARPGTVPLSFAQQRLWFLDQLESDRSIFNISRAIRIIGHLDVPALEKSFRALIARHESLRTNFKLIDGEAAQVILPAREMEISRVDIRGLRPEERELEFQRLGAEAGRRPFDLANDALLRAVLFQLEDDHHVLWLTIHHIVSDAWSLSILFREMGALYEAFVKGQPSPLPELPIQYADFALWQREWLRGEVLEKQLDYWKKQLADAPAVFELPTDKPRPAIQTFNGTYHWQVLTRRLSDSLSALSRTSGTTLFMTLLAAFQVLLYLYTNQDDVVVGTPIANRTRRETEDLIGFFVNTLVIRTDLSGNPSFRDLLQRVREVALQAYANQDLPFEKLVEGLKPERSLSHTPLFQILFAVQNAPESPLALSDLKMQELHILGQAAKFDLSLYVVQTDEGLRLTFEYNTDLFNATTIARMGRHFEMLLEGAVSNPDQPLSSLPLLSDAERHQLLVEWTNTSVDYPRRCIHELFEEQAKLTPDAPAVIFEKQQMNFNELDRRANQLAHYLRRRDVGTEAVIAVCMERTIEMVTALLGILKAGAAFVPIDPSYPAERVAFLLQDSGASIVLTQARVRETLPASAAEMICVDSDWTEIARESPAGLPSGATPENAAYVIYTSGSTGQPKGSVSPHQASLNRFAWMWNAYPFAADEVCCQKTSLSFGDSIWEIFGPLLQGISLVIIPDDALKDPRRLVEMLSENGVTRLVLVPSLLRVILELETDLAKKVPRLKYWTSSGEALPAALARSFKEKLPDATLINLYGSSELAADVTCYEVSDSTLSNIPIGRPIDNTAAYILDGRFEPGPVGVCGELYIAGAGLARCYLSHPELTAEKLLPSPFGNDPGARMFKTGDLARYHEDGTIEFMGRADHQVKVRGFRVELGEIEAALKSHPSVKNAVVTLRQVSDDSRLLVGYVVPNTKHVAVEYGKLSAELRKFLKAKLPEYMVPGAFILLEELPLTPSGKIDRRSLPAPGGFRPELEDARVAPRDDLEELLVHIWEKLLGVKPIGIQDNFFDLGGHSLLAVRLVSDIEKEVGQRIPLVSFFQGATIEYLAGLLRQDPNSVSWPTLVEIQTGGTKPPLFCVSTPNLNALGYRSLARHLGPDQPVFGLQAQYPEDLEGEHSPAAVDHLATEYLEALRAVRPSGPYQFVGLCRGAHIAYEMARRLEQDGQEVVFVGILDTWVLENTYNRFLYLEHYTGRLRSFLREILSEQLSFLTRRAGNAKLPERPTRVTTESVTTKRRNPRSVYFPGPDFVPKDYNGRITVFRVQRQPLNRIRDRQLGWGRLARGGVDVHIVPGGHVTFLQEPYVRQLAEEIKKCL